MLRSPRIKVLALTTAVGFPLLLSAQEPIPGTPPVIRFATEFAGQPVKIGCGSWRGGSADTVQTVDLVLDDRDQPAAGEIVVLVEISPPDSALSELPIEFGWNPAGTTDELRGGCAGNSGITFQGSATNLTGAGLRIMSTKPVRLVVRERSYQILAGPFIFSGHPWPNTIRWYPKPSS